VTDGIIRDLRIFGDYFNMCETEVIEEALKDIQHSEAKIREALSPYNISDYFNNLTIDEFMQGMF
jgi:lipoate-protein ligase A